MSLPYSPDRAFGAPRTGSARSLAPAIPWLGGVTILLALFPQAGLWRFVQERRNVVNEDVTVLLAARDYPGMVGVLNAGGTAFLAAVAVLLLIALAVRKEGTLRQAARYLGVATLLLAIQGAGLAWVTAVALRTRPAASTSEWRPRRVVPGARVVVMPTRYRQEVSWQEIAFGGFDPRAAELPAGVRDVSPPLPGFGGVFRKWGVEAAFDPARWQEARLSFEMLWDDPYSTFDAPRPKSYVDPEYRLRMVPHLLVETRATPSGLYRFLRWAGEFRSKRP